MTDLGDYEGLEKNKGFSEPFCSEGLSSDGAQWAGVSLSAPNPKRSVMPVDLFDSMIREEEEEANKNIDDLNNQVYSKNRNFEDYSSFNLNSPDDGAFKHQHVSQLPNNAHMPPPSLRPLHDYPSVPNSDFTPALGDPHHRSFGFEPSRYNSEAKPIPTNRNYGPGLATYPPSTAALPLSTSPPFHTSGDLSLGLGDRPNLNKTSPSQDIHPTNVDTSIEFIVTHTCRKILTNAAEHSLKAVELANTLRARLGTEVLATARERWGGLLSLLERYPDLFRVRRVPKNDKVTLLIPLPLHHQQSMVPDGWDPRSLEMSHGEVGSMIAPARRSQCPSSSPPLSSPSPPFSSTTTSATHSPYLQDLNTTGEQAGMHEGHYYRHDQPRGDTRSPIFSQVFSRCLHVGNVPATLTEFHLMTEFAKFGQLDGLKLVSQRNDARRFAFIKYCTIEQAVSAKHYLSKVHPWKGAISFAHRDMNEVSHGYDNRSSRWQQQSSSYPPTYDQGHHFKSQMQIPYAMGTGGQSQQNRHQQHQQHQHYQHYQHYQQHQQQIEEDLNDLGELGAPMTVPMSSERRPHEQGQGQGQGGSYPGEPQTTEGTNRDDPIGTTSSLREQTKSADHVKSYANSDNWSALGRPKSANLLSTTSGAECNRSDTGSLPACGQQWDSASDTIRQQQQHYSQLPDQNDRAGPDAGAGSMMNGPYEGYQSGGIQNCHSPHGSPPSSRQNSGEGAGSDEHMTVLERLCDDTYVPTQPWPVNRQRDHPYFMAIVTQLEQLGGSTPLSKLRGFLRNRVAASANIKSVPLKAMMAAYPQAFVVQNNYVSLTEAYSGERSLPSYPLNPQPQQLQSQAQSSRFQPHQRYY